MLAMFKKELRSYFRGVTGFVFIALLLVVLGLYASMICFSYGSPHYEYVFYNCSFIFLIAIPVLTMRSFSEERRQKTDQLLYSLPVSTAQIVVGKYLAMLCVFVIPILVACIYPLHVRLYDPSGLLSYTAIYSAILAFFCLGAALISIGMFISSLTENVFVSAIVSFVTLLICYLMGQLADAFPDAPSATTIVFAIMIFLLSLLAFFMTKSVTVGWISFLIMEVPIVVISFAKPTLLEGLLPKVFSVLSMFDRFYMFADGMFDVKVIIYFASISVLFTLFTVQSMEKRRWI